MLLAPLALAPLLLAPPAPAQAVRAVVRPQGVFYVRTVGGLAPAGVPGAAVSAPGPNLRWTYPNPVGLPWITESVATGGNGSFAWLAQNLNFERLTLVASTDDQTPAAPIFEVPAPGAIANPVLRVAAADEADLAALLVFDGTTGQAAVDFFSPFSQIPTASLPNVRGVEIEMSDDGQVTAVGFTNGQGRASALLVDPAGIVLGTITIPPTGSFDSLRELALSSDGKVVLLASHTDDFLFDAQTGALLFQDGTTVSVDAHTIDGDGDTWGRGGFDVGLWKRIGGVYQRLVAFNDPSFSFAVFDACGLSQDGSTFVVTGRDATSSGVLKVYCFGVGATQAQLLWTFSAGVPGASLQDVGTGVALSDDGRFIAVGNWGSEQNAHGEALFFDRDLGPTPIFQLDTPGSVFAIDLSGNGRFATVGTKAVHANQFGNGGEGYTVDIGGRTHRLVGTPSLGRTVLLETFGTPGEPVLWMLSLGLLPAPVPIPGFSGALCLDPNLFVLPPTAVGAVPPSGVFQIGGPVPASPALVGLSVHSQTARLGTPKALDDCTRLPITP